MKNENDIGPEDSCLICAQKHFLAAEGAIKEPGYEKSEKNHDFAIRELVLAAPHVQQDFPELAQKIRDVRHFVQYWQYDKIGNLWQEVKHTINVAIIKELKIPSSAVDLAPAAVSSASSVPIRTNPYPSVPVRATRTIYIFSNVAYPESRKIQPAPGDILVFLNKAVSAGYYRHDPVVRFAWHRSQKKDYGEIVPGCINQYVFDEEKKGNGLPKEFIDRLKKDYDWDYKIEEEKDKDGNVKKVVKSMTTGYMVVKFLAEKYPNHKIVLVNFGYNVSKSTYRCPWHNWEFEAEQLKAFEHIYTAETVEPEEVKKPEISPQTP